MELRGDTQLAHRLGLVRQCAVLQHDPYAGAVVGVGLPWVGTKDADLASVRALQTLCAFDGRRLAGAVGPEHRGHAPMASGPCHARKGGGCAKSLGEIAHSHGLSHGRSLGHASTVIGMTAGLVSS